MLTSIDVKFIFDSVCLSASLGDRGLFSSANILQMADVELSSCCSCYVFSQYTLVRLFLPRETSEIFRHFVVKTRSFRLTDNFSGNYAAQLTSFFT